MRPRKVKFVNIQKMRREIRIIETLIYPKNHITPKLFTLNRQSQWRNFEWIVLKYRQILNSKFTIYSEFVERNWFANPKNKLIEISPNLILSSVLVQRRILQCMYGTSFTRITQRCSRTVTVVLDNDHLGFDLKQRNCLLPSCIATKHITFRDVRVFRPGKYGLLCRLSSVTDDQCFSIILSTGKTLFFLADSPESVKTWVSTGNYLKSVFNNMSLTLQREIWMWEFFKIADKNGDGKITLTEIKRLFKKINLQLEEYYRRDS